MNFYDQHIIMISYNQITSDDFVKYPPARRINLQGVKRTQGHHNDEGRSAA